MVGMFIGSRITEHQAQKQIKKTWENALAKGYELGWKMRNMKANNMGFVISAQIDEIMRGR